MNNGGRRTQLCGRLGSNPANARLVGSRSRERAGELGTGPGGGRGAHRVVPSARPQSTRPSILGARKVGLHNNAAMLAVRRSLVTFRTLELMKTSHEMKEGSKILSSQLDNKLGQQGVRARHPSRSRLRRTLLAPSRARRAQGSGWLSVPAARALSPCRSAPAEGARSSD